MIKFHGVDRLESIEPLEPNIVPGSFVRHPDDPGSIGVVIGVEYLDRRLWAQVMWTNFTFDTYENVGQHRRSTDQSRGRC